MTPSLADALTQAWRQQHQLSAGGWGLADGDAAYAVQDHLVAALGWAAGPAQAPQYWKSGGGSRALPLTHAPLAPRGVRVLSSQQQQPVDFSDLKLHAPGVEAEIALRIGRDVTPSQAAALDYDTARALVDAFAVSVELVSSRWQEGGDAPLLLRQADCLSHGALALGEWLPMSAWPLDWSAQALELQINDSAPLQGLGCHSLGDPAWVLSAWLQHATRHGASVAAGSVVTTGAWLLQLGLQAGDSATVSFAGLGQFSVQL